MGPCNSGYWESPAASPVGLNGRSRYRGSQGRVPGGVCIFPISVWSGTACLLNRLHGLPEALHCSYPVSQNLTDSSYGAKRCGLRLQDVWARPWDTRGFFRHDRRSAAGFTRCVGGDFYMPRKRDPQNAYRVRANIPTNSPDQLGTVILLIMKFSTPDFAFSGMWTPSVGYYVCIRW